MVESKTQNTCYSTWYQQDSQYKKTILPPWWVKPNFIFSSLKCFTFSNLCQCVSPVKLKGYSFEVIFTILTSMPFIDSASVNSMLNGYVKHHIQASKDTFYRLKNSPAICWRLVLWLFAAKFKKLTQNDTNNQGLIRCMVFDDTVIEKTGRFIEKVSRVWDHVSQSYSLGFKLLLMGYGDSFFYGRVMETDLSKIDCAIKMLKRAVSQGFMVDYVLMDSWFTCDAFINAVLTVKTQTVHLIGMYKIAKTKFEYMGKKFTYGELRNSLGKPMRCRKLGFYYTEAVVGFRGYQIKLFFSKHGKDGKWKVLLCTNTRLSFIAIENYESKIGMFAEIKEETTMQRLSQRLWALFVEIMQIVQIIFDEFDEEELMEKIFQNDLAYEHLTRLLGEPINRKSVA